MVEPVRIITSDTLNEINTIFNTNYPQFPDWVKKMVLVGRYAVVDSEGTRLPAERAAELIK